MSRVFYPQAAAQIGAGPQSTIASNFEILKLEDDAERIIAERTQVRRPAPTRADAHAHAHAHAHARVFVLARRESGRGCTCGGP